MPSIPPRFQLLPLASPRAKREQMCVSLPLPVYSLGSPSSRLQRYLCAVAHRNWIPCCSKQNLLGISEQVGAPEVQWSWPTGAWTRPGTHQSNPSYGSNSMTEDGGEQPMWRLIGSSRTPRHMAVLMWKTSRCKPHPVNVSTVIHTKPTGQDKLEFFWDNQFRIWVQSWLGGMGSSAETTPSFEYSWGWRELVIY
jgi:hypothetical protein